MEQMNFLAVDLGATSGRTILGSIVDGKLQQRELTRFPNNIIEQDGHCFWDIQALFSEIVRGLKLCADEGIVLQSVGIDTWGVDFACVDEVVGGEGGNGISCNPYCYRDSYTDGIMDEYFRLVPKEKVYAKTGIQFMPFNSLFQLAAQRKQNDKALAHADKILFMPDALTYMLTGEAVCEQTILSTSQLLNARTGEIDKELLEPLGLSTSQFGRRVQPGEKVGVLSPQVQRLTGLGPIDVVAVAGHDTASAVAAVPAEDGDYAYLSCGTWSLLGIESPNPIINEKSFDYNFTNEGGIEGTTRFLKNICGMWLLERCRKEWTDAPEDVNTINRKAMEAEPFRSFINPDDPRFANPQSMVNAIEDYCRETGQPVPRDYREMARCIFESLAMRYRQVVDMLCEMAPVRIDRLHVIGGGSRNQYLMQMAANVLAMPVLTGPVEGTAIGNMMVQAKAAGLVSDRFEMRSIIAQSIDMATFMPQDTDLWQREYERYRIVTDLNK